MAARYPPHDNRTRCFLHINIAGPSNGFAHLARFFTGRARLLHRTMTTATESGLPDMSAAEIESTMGTIKKMIGVGALFVVAGYLLLVVAGVETAFVLFEWADATKMWFKLGGVAHILVGIFISLVAIIRTLSLVPHRLGNQLAE